MHADARGHPHAQKCRPHGEKRRYQGEVTASPPRVPPDLPPQVLTTLDRLSRRIYARARHVRLCLAWIQGDPARPGLRLEANANPESSRPPRILRSRARAGGLLRRACSTPHRPRTQVSRQWRASYAEASAPRSPPRTAFGRLGLLAPVPSRLAARERAHAALAAGCRAVRQTPSRPTATHSAACQTARPHRAHHL